MHLKKNSNPQKGGETHMSGRKYTDTEKRDYLDIASQVGHSRARRELGYPNSWSTANLWAKEYGVEIALDELKAKSAAFNQWYGTEEQLIAMQEAIARGSEYINTKDDLTPDEYKKTVEGMKRAIETMQLLQGKATSRSGQEVQEDPFEKLLEASLRAQGNADDLRDQAH